MQAPSEAKLKPIILPDLSTNSRILVAESWDVAPHLETGLEIALRLAASYTSVNYCHYGYLLPTCECSRRLALSPKYRLLGYNEKPATEGLRLALDYANRNGLNLKSISAPVSCQNIHYIIHESFLESIEALQTACFEESPSLGLSVASSLASITLDSHVAPRDHATLVNALATSFVRAYHISKYLLQTGSFNAIVLFNGRFATVKGAVLAAQKLSVPVFYHERGSSKDSFTLRSYQPHNRVAVQEDICKTWTNHKSDAAKATAEKFFISKKLGQDKAWVSFKQNMIAGQAQRYIQAAQKKSKTGKIITFFSSSEDEFIFVKDAFERSCFEWDGQDQVFMAISALAKKYGHALILRNHPHLQAKAAADRLKWDTLSFMDDKQDIVVVESGSSVDSNELIEFSDLIIVHGSTVGIEAVFWSKPVILVADSFYDLIGASVYKPLSIKDLDGLISRLSNLAVTPDSALPYGYYMSVFGIEYQLYKPITLFQGQFLGHDLGAMTKLHKILSSLKKKILMLAQSLGLAGL